MQADAPSARALERIREPDRDTFRRRHLETRRPVVIAGALEDWPAPLRSFADLVRRAGELEVDADRMRGAPFVFRRKGRTPTTRMRLQTFVESEALREGYVQARRDQMTERLGLGATRLPFAPESFLRRIDTLWIGGAAGYGLHQDIGTDQFLCQLAGRKRVLLLADTLRHAAALRLEPLWSGRFYRSRIAEALPAEGPDAPALHGLERHIDTLEPGEVLYIPCAWFHALRPLEPGIAVGHRYVGARRFAASVAGNLTRHLAASLARAADSRSCA